MNPDEIVKALHAQDKPDMAYGYGGAYKWTAERIGPDAADLIESLQAQLAELQRCERAAVRELNGILGQIDEDEYLRKAFCVHPGNEDCPSEKENGYVDVDDCVGCPLFENSWHGQEAGR